MNSRTMLALTALVVGIATLPLPAQYTASITITCKEIGFGQGTAANSSEQVKFTTHDGSSGPPLTQTRTIGGARVEDTSGEFRPDPETPGNYLADYLVFDSSGGSLIEYGSISITLPVEDSDGDYLPDIVEPGFATELAFTGSVAPDYVAGEARVTKPLITGTLERQSFEAIGRYRMDLLIAGPMTGSFEVQQWFGTLEYRRYPRPMRNWAGLTLQENVFGDRLTIRGSARFTTSLENPALTLERLITRPHGFKTLPPTQLNFVGDRYVGDLVMADGNPATKWNDFTDWTVIIIDGIDTDGDGIPEISDAIPPMILKQPVDKTAHLGGSAMFSVKVMGDPPLQFQWQANGVNIPGAIHSTLRLKNLLESQAGNYRVIVSGPGGTNSSSSAHLIVNPWGHVD